MYIDQIQLKGRTLDEAILRYKDELERIIIESIQENQIGNKQFSQSNNSQNTPLFKVLLWIKKSLGKQINLNDLSFPNSYRINDFVGSFNGYGINIRTRLYKHRIIDFSKNPIFKVNISWFSNHLEYSMQVVDNKEMVSVNCQVPSYEALLALSNFIGYDNRSFIDSLTKQIKTLLENAGNDKDKLDIIYERVPAEILREIKLFEDLKTDLNILTDTNWSDYIDGISEEKAIVTALKALLLEDASRLYKYYLDYPKKVLLHYNKLSGANLKQFVGIILELCEKNRKFKTGNYVVLPDGYWFKKEGLMTKESNGLLEIINTTQESTNLERRILTSFPGTGRTELERRGFTKIKPLPGTDAFIREYVEPHLISKPFEVHPLCFVKVRTPIEVTDKSETKYAETELPAILLKYTEDKINKKVFWDVVNVVTSLAGGYGAIRLLTIKGVGTIAKSVAIVQLSKESIELAMLSSKFRKLLTHKGLGWLVKNWTLISITTDISTLGIQGIINLIKNGKKGAKVLKEAEYLDEAAFLEKQTKKAFDEIEELTGVDVRNMSDVEFDEFVRNNPALKTIKNKVRNNSMLEWKDIGANIRGTSKYSPHEIESFLQIEKKYKANFRPSMGYEAGDVIAGSGTYKGQSFDAVGIPKSGFRGLWVSNDPLKRQRAFNNFIGSVDRHFKKINKPIKGKPSLDRVIIDFKNFDDFDMTLRERVMNHITSDNYIYKKYVNNNYLDIIN